MFVVMCQETPVKVQYLYRYHGGHRDTYIQKYIHTYTYIHNTWLNHLAIARLSTVGLRPTGKALQ